MRPALFLLLLLAACGATTPDQQEGSRDGASVTIVRGSEMSGTLLEGLRTRVPTMRVYTNTGTCPQIVLRGIRSGRNQGNPSIYVDGALMADTCILQQILASDVDRVEIYMGGNAPNIGLPRNPFGFILIYRITSN